MRAVQVSALAGLIAIANAVPGLITKRDDAVCDDSQNIDNNGYYNCYVENSATNIIGDGQTVSGDLNCDVGANCPDTVSSTYTVEQSFSFNVGIDGGYSAENSFKGGASLGASWEWSTSSANSVTQGFTLAPGDAGHILFFPYLHQSCGALAVQGQECDNGVPPSRLFKRYCSMSDDFVVNDPNACGTTAILIHNGDQTLANGCLQFCHTDEAKRGVGCTADTNVCVPPQ